MLPNSIFLSVLIGCNSIDELPPLGSYYDFTNRFGLGNRNIYSLTSLLPPEKNGKKPKKLFGPDGKLLEPDDPCSITTKDIVSITLDGKPASENPETALQTIFSLLATLPSIQMGLSNLDDLTISDNGTAVVSQCISFRQTSFFLQSFLLLSEFLIQTLLRPRCPMGVGQ